MVIRRVKIKTYYIETGKEKIEIEVVPHYVELTVQQEEENKHLYWCRTLSGKEFYTNKDGYTLLTE